MDRQEAWRGGWGNGAPVSVSRKHGSERWIFHAQQEMEHSGCCEARPWRFPTWQAKLLCSVWGGAFTQLKWGRVVKGEACHVRLTVVHAPPPSPPITIADQVATATRRNMPKCKEFVHGLYVAVVTVVCNVQRSWWGPSMQFSLEPSALSASQHREGKWGGIKQWPWKVKYMPRLRAEDLSLLWSHTGWAS